MLTDNRQLIIVTGWLPDNIQITPKYFVLFCPFMRDYVDYPQEYGHGFDVLRFIFAVSHILADSCDFYNYILLCSLVGVVGYAKYGIFLTFSSQISNKSILIFLSFSCGLVQIHN